MTEPVPISAIVEIGELRAEIGFLRNRSLIMGQAVHDLKAQVADLQARIASTEPQPEAS